LTEIRICGGDANVCNEKYLVSHVPGIAVYRDNERFCPMRFMPGERIRHARSAHQRFAR
jgi:hypothetical protein